MEFRFLYEHKFKDFKTAEFWYKKAADAGDKDAIERMKKFRKLDKIYLNDEINKDYCVPHVNDMIREQREILLDSRRPILIRIPTTTIQANKLLRYILRMIIEEQIEQIHNNPNNNTIHA